MMMSQRILIGGQLQPNDLWFLNSNYILIRLWSSLITETAGARGLVITRKESYIYPPVDQAFRHRGGPSDARLLIKCSLHLQLPPCVCVCVCVCTCYLAVGAEALPLLTVHVVVVPLHTKPASDNIHKPIHIKAYLLWSFNPSMSKLFGPLTLFDIWFFVFFSLGFECFFSMRGRQKRMAAGIVPTGNAARMLPSF